MLGIYPAESLKLIPEQVWCESFFACIVNLCLDPQSVGFNLSDLDVSSQLPVKTKTFLKLFTQHASSSVQAKCRSACVKLIDGDAQKFKSLVEGVKAAKSGETTASDWLKLSQQVSGYEQLSECGMYVISLDFNRIIFEYICNEASSDEQESMSCVEAKRKLLSLSLNLNYAALR